jgi:hypothetical protein
VSVALVAPVPPRRREVPAAAVDADHLVCGVAASRECWKPRQFHAWLAWRGDGRDVDPVPVLAGHQLSYAPGRPGDGSLGRCLRFASVPAHEGFPGGLVVLAALDPVLAPGMLAAMRGGQWGAMSVGGVDDGDLWVTEVSLVDTGRQRDPAALVVGTGRDAAAAWELLTGLPAGAGG